MRVLRVSLALVVASCGSVGLLVACNGIIGVEDVRLRKDSGIADVGEDVEDLETGTSEGGPKPGENVLEVALGFAHTCARKPDLTVKCWGDDRSGQTGTGGNADGGLLLTPQPVPIPDAIRIASGKNHTCVVRKGGKVNCWGDNVDGQIGNGLTNARSPQPVEVKDISDAVTVACGASFSCAVRRTGTVLCWGNGLGGQLGNNMRAIQPTPQGVSNLTNVVSVSAGESHACAVKEDGTLLCWGDGFAGQLGNGDQLDRTTPTLVPALDSVATVAAGARSTCALKKTGAIFCWGENKFGQLGTGTAAPPTVPSPGAIPNLDATALWAGNDHACAVKRGGSVVCWGAGYLGQIGDGQTRADALTPTPTPSGVLGLTSAVKVGTGGNHSCATSGTNILCWGENDRGQLGTGSVGGTLLSPDSVVGY